VMLSAAYYQEGLTFDQRSLLREIAIEIARGGETEAAAIAAQPYSFFSPSPARVRFPVDTSTSVAANISSYESRKSALRKELYDAVYKQDSAWINARRTAALKSLGRQQAGEFAVLEELAEEIRRELAPMPTSARRSPVVELPPVLAQRIVAMYRRPVIEQLRIRGEVGKIQGRYPDLNIGGYFSQNLFLHEINTRGSSLFSAKIDQQRKQAQQELSALRDAYAQAISTLSAERDALRPEIAAALGTSDPAKLELVFTEGQRQMVDEDSAVAASNYTVAVFEPGLSPGQRRLLFDLAVDQLDLPLPGGDLQPVRRRDPYARRPR
jgi:hypothetical protein